jgi:hypothetical protein
MLAATASPLTLVDTLPLPVLRPLAGASRASVLRLPITGREAEVLSPSQPFPCPGAGFVCADDARCVCPLYGHATDAERAVMNSMARQAAQIRSVLVWVLALVGLAALVLVMLR